MIESEIEKKLRHQLMRRVPEALCLKFVSPGFSGVPDRIVLLPGGKIVFVELKQVGKKERPRQVYVQTVLRRLGFTVYSSVCNEQQIREIVDTCESWVRIRGGS